MIIFSYYFIFIMIIIIILKKNYINLIFLIFYFTLK